MYLWLKRWFYGCEHDYQFVGQYNTWDNTDTYVIKKTSIYRCPKCMKVKKDVFK